MDYNMHAYRQVTEQLQVLFMKPCKTLCVAGAAGMPTAFGVHGVNSCVVLPGRLAKCYSC